MATRIVNSATTLPAAVAANAYANAYDIITYTDLGYTFVANTPLNAPTFPSLTENRVFFTDGLSASNCRITNIANPVNNQDAVNKQLLWTSLRSYLPAAGASTAGGIQMGAAKKMALVAGPAAYTDAATKKCADTNIFGYRPLFGGAMRGLLTLPTMAKNTTISIVSLSQLILHSLVTVASV